MALVGRLMVALTKGISIDPRVAALGADAGDFAVLLYTWMILHSQDGHISADPGVLELLVVPGLLRAHPRADVESAIEAMIAAGLVEHTDRVDDEDDDIPPLRFID